MLHEGSSPRQAEEVEGLKPRNDEQEEWQMVGGCSPGCSLAWKPRGRGAGHPHGFCGLPVGGIVCCPHRA